MVVFAACGRYRYSVVSGTGDAIASLATSPSRCPLAPENADSPFEVRHLLYGRRPHVYRILFTIGGNTVTVLHIRHGRRQSVSPH